MLWRRSRSAPGFALPSFVSPCHHEAVRREESRHKLQAHVDGLNKCATQQLSRRRLSAVLPFQLLFSRDPRSSYGSTTPSPSNGHGGRRSGVGDEIGRNMAAPRPAKRARTEPTIRLSGGTAVPDGLLTQWREGGVFCDAEIVGDTTIKAHDPRDGQRLFQGPVHSGNEGRARPAGARGHRTVQLQGRCRVYVSRRVCAVEP